MNPVALVEQLTIDSHPPLPPPLKYGLHCLTFAHKGWWFVRKKNLYTNADNFLPLTAGHLLNSFVGSKALRHGAKILLVVTRIEETSRQLLILRQDYSQFVDALRGNYVCIHAPQWRRSNSAHLLSPASLNEMTSHWKQASSLTTHIAKSGACLSKQLGVVSMHLWDTYDSFFATDEAVQELFVNGFKWFDKLNDAKDDFAAALKANKPMIAKILIATRTPITADLFINSVIKALRTTQKVTKAANKVNRISGELIRQGLYDFMKIFRSTKLIPKKMLPQSQGCPRWKETKPEKIYGHYPLKI